MSMLTDISSEATNAVLPVYLTLGLGLSPLAYGPSTVSIRVPRWWCAWWAAGSPTALTVPKPVAFVGYGVSAVARIAFIFAGSLAGITARLGGTVRERVCAPHRETHWSQQPVTRSSWGVPSVSTALDTTGAALGRASRRLLAALPGDYTSVFVVSCAAAMLGLAVLVLLVPDLRPSRLTPPVGALARPSLRLLADRRLGGLLGAAGLLAVLTISDGFLYLALQQREGWPCGGFPCCSWAPMWPTSSSPSRSDASPTGWDAPA